MAHPAGDLADARRRRSDDADAPSAAGPQVVADDLVIALIAKLFELGVQVDGVGVALGPAPVQVCLEGVKLAGPGLVTAVEYLLGCFGSGCPADGTAAHVQFPDDLPDAVSLVKEGVDDRVAFTLSGFDGRHLLRRVLRLGGGDIRHAVCVGVRWFEAGVVSAHAAFHRGAEVLQQVEGVCDLDRVGCSGAGAVGIRPGPVPADDLRAGMGQQPGGQRPGRAAGPGADRSRSR
ncbi:hypothetical protein [Streptomyces sp. NPDC096142]|uniref:hypothetical protein n=1 Tax=Streptomyces sp. NPDC096142 TaxID=3366077 RepID=UPI0038081AE4